MICVLMMASGAAWESAALARLTASRRRRGAQAVRRRRRPARHRDQRTGRRGGGRPRGARPRPGGGRPPEEVRRPRRSPSSPAPTTRTCSPGPQRIEVRALVAFDDPDGLAEAVTTVEDVADTRVRPEPRRGGRPSSRAGRRRRRPSPRRGLGTRRCARAHHDGGHAGLASSPRRGRDTVLVDADPYGGGVAQQLGILDEVSGHPLRRPAGRLRAPRRTVRRRPAGASVTACASSPACPGPTGGSRSAPRPWSRSSSRPSSTGDVVVDTGFSLEDEPGQDFGSRPSRNAMTLTALDLADEVVVVGSADPVGLSRLARGLVELRDRTGGAPVRVVVNRMRPTLGWSEREIAGMVEGFSRVLGLHFLPDDRAGRRPGAGRRARPGRGRRRRRCCGGSGAWSTRCSPTRWRPRATPVDERVEGRWRRCRREGLVGRPLSHLVG